MSSHYFKVVRTTSALNDLNPHPDVLNADGSVNIARSTEPTGAMGAPYLVRGFNGNTISITYESTGGALPESTTILVDNVNPNLVTLSPTVPLIVKGNVDITFSADVTDGGAGFPTGNTATGSGQGTIHTAIDNGSIKLVVAGNDIDLKSTNFTKIDDGWRVSSIVNSRNIQNISVNSPWYLVVTDRAGNVRRTPGSVKGVATMQTAK